MEQAHFQSLLILSSKIQQSINLKELCYKKLNSMFQQDKHFNPLEESKHYLLLLSKTKCKLSNELTLLRKIITKIFEYRA